MTSVRAMQPLKAAEGISFTSAGIVMVLIRLFLAKAPDAMRRMGSLFFTTNLAAAASLVAMRQSSM